MPKFNDRFARQNRYEPPPEFPLASPYSGIVHHLSGPNMCAHTQTVLPKDWGRWIVPLRSNHYHLHYALRFSTSALAHMLDSLVRVSRREEENHFVDTVMAPPRKGTTRTAMPQIWWRQHVSTDKAPQRPIRKQTGKYGTTNTSFLRFTFSNFRYSLTLFSKFFASFPHGTCALSVSHLYLALDGIYHLLWAAIPNNSTLEHLPHHTGSTGVSPSLLPFSRGLVPAMWRQSWQTTIRCKKHRLAMWASPFSVALTKGILVSFFSSA